MAFAARFQNFGESGGFFRVFSPSPPNMDQGPPGRPWAAQTPRLKRRGSPAICPEALRRFPPVGSLTSSGSALRSCTNSLGGIGGRHVLIKAGISARRFAGTRRGASLPNFRGSEGDVRHDR